MRRPRKSTLALNIRRARQAAGLSQRQAAILARINRPEFVYFEAGQRIPNATRLAMIARALDTTVSELCRGVDASLLE